jgi:hypothetical protein
MATCNNYQKLLDAKGIPLTELGIKDIALVRDDALYAVSLLKKDLIPILGGDVYYRCGAKIRIAYANWYTNTKTGEDRDSFMARSWLTTIDYIRNFPNKRDMEPLFGLVPELDKNNE